MYIKGDRILATDSASQQWQKPQDVRLNLNYPQSGIGAVITYLEVIVDQSSNQSRAYVRVYKFFSFYFISDSYSLLHRIRS